MNKIKVSAPDAETKFRQWIETRGGVQVWDNIDLSNCGAGPIFTPALDADNNLYPNPSWRVARGETITDITQFEFITLQEVARTRIAVRCSNNGLMLKLTDGSTRKVHKLLEKFNTDHYRFDYDTQEVVILAERGSNT